MRYCGTIICFGGSMSNYLEDNVYINQVFDYFAKENNGTFLGKKGNSYLRFIPTKCGKARLLEKLDFQDGSGPIIGVGFAGAILKDMNVADLILPSRVSSEEQKIPSFEYPDLALSSKLIENLNKDFKKVYRSMTYTVISLESETPELIAMLAHKEFSAVDMELYFFLNYCRTANLPASAVLVVSDNLITLPLKLKTTGGDLPLDSETLVSTEKLLASISKFLLEKH